MMSNGSERSFESVVSLVENVDDVRRSVKSVRTNRKEKSACVERPGQLDLEVRRDTHDKGKCCGWESATRRETSRGDARR
jgi:hypothetical protein